VRALALAEELEGGVAGSSIALTDGRIDEGRRPEAGVEWRDLGQATGDGSFTSPDKASP
jgi:hypothetical protein